MSKKHSKMSLPVQMVIGLVLGVIVGSMTSAEFTAAYLRPFGQLFITLIRMVVVPLVLATIIAGAAGIHDLSKLGRVATKTLVYYFLTTGVAVAHRFVPRQHHAARHWAGSFHERPGGKADHAAQPDPDSAQHRAYESHRCPRQGQHAAGHLLCRYFRLCPELPRRNGQTPLLRIFELIGDVMIRMTNMVMMYAPIGVFGLISYTVSQHGLKVLLPLGKLILVSAIASVLHVIICYSPLVKYVVRIPLPTFFRGVFEPWLIAFTTCSSAAALPTNLQSVRRLGASKGVASFSIPLGNTINMDGTAIYMGVAAVFAAEVYGIPLTLSDQLTVMLMGLLASIGTAGVPGAGLIMVSLVFTQISIPLEALALIAGIDRVLDMIRTSINVLGDATGALLVSKLEGDLNTEPFAENEDVSELNTGTETFE